MTVEAENEDGPRDYSQIKFVEFLEFIGRVAYIKFKNDPEKHDTMSMAHKIFNLLKNILPIIHEAPIDPEDANCLESDSDNDY